MPDETRRTGRRAVADQSDRGGPPIATKLIELHAAGTAARNGRIDGLAGLGFAQPRANVVARLAG